MLTVKICGTGSYLPTRVVTNEEMSVRIGSSPEWIYSHTGIASRHVAAESESAATMGAEAARRALESARVKPEDISMIALATTTPDYGNYPSTACLVQRSLGCIPAAAFDLSAACSGFVYGLEMVKSYLLCHPGHRALVIGSEVLSRHVDWSDRSCAMLFGDGAAAAVLETADGPAHHLSASLLGADGSGSDLILRGGGARKPLSADFLRETATKMDVPYLQMDGHAAGTRRLWLGTDLGGDACRMAVSVKSETETYLQTMRSERDQTTGEEIANTLTHAIGSHLGAAMLAILVWQGVSSGTQVAWKATSAAVFGASMILLYAVSSAYHAVSHAPAKRILQILDHMAIFFLIAGSYTPFCLVSLRPEHPALAWSIFGVEWGLTLLGVAFKVLTTGRYRFVSTLSYIIMGWVAILAIIPLAQALQGPGTMWLVLGGGLYTLGCVFYLWRALPYSHMVWHLFVLAGTISHFFCILWHVMV